MHSYSLTFALMLLAPAPGADPAPPSFPIAIDTRASLPDGRIIHLQGTISGTIEEAPTPPPGPTITAMRNQAGQGVTQIRAGEVLVIEGTGLWREGVQVRAQIPGRAATLLSAAATRLTVRFPAVTESVTGPLQLYVNQGSGWTLVATGPRITVLPAAPGRPLIRSFRDGAIQGEGFGQRAGVVWVNWSRWPALSWSDGEIRLPALASASDWYPVGIHVETAGGDWAYRWALVGEP